MGLPVSPARRPAQQEEDTRPEQKREPGEPGEPRDAEEQPDGSTSAGHARTRGRARSTEAEEELAGDRMRVVGDDPPADEVGAIVHAGPQPDVDDTAAATGVERVAQVGTMSGRVEHLNAPERHLDGLAEVEIDDLRRLG